jgi:Holliday junction resolvasome RuvABC endonuclease subunit
MKVMALDLALASTGYACVRDDELAETGVITTDAAKTGCERLLRAQHLYEYLQWLLIHHQEYEIAIEFTDWGRGKGNDREDWIIEAKALQALATAEGVVACVCAQLGVTPIVIGPREWHREFGAEHKLAIAEIVAAQFPKQFRMGTRELRQRRTGKVEIERRCFDAGTGRCVPDHVTDAVAIAIVVRNRIQHERVLAQAEAPA